MQSRQYPKHYIEHLEQQLHDLSLQAQVLAEQQQSLRVEHSLVSTCCEVLHLIRTGAVHRRWRRLRKKRAGGFLPQELPLLLDLGFQLDLSQLPELQQVVAEHQQQRQQQRQQQQSCMRFTRSRAAAGQNTALPRTSIQQRLADDSSSLPWQHQQQQQPGSRGKSAAKPEAAPRQQLFLMPGECLGPLRHALSQAPFPGATKFTLAGVVQQYTSLVKNISFSLHLMDQQQPAQEPGGGDAQAEQMARLKELMLDHSVFLFSIMLLHPEDLMSQLQIVNCETLELSDTPEQAYKRMCWLAEQLELTAEQCRALTAGGSLFKRLLETVRAERQQHVSRQQAQAGERLPSGRAVDLQGQQDMADRLAVLVRKELLLLGLSTAFVGSVLDVRQMAVMSVLAWPWVPHLGMLAAVLATQHAEKEQQQQTSLAAQQQQQGSSAEEQQQQQQPSDQEQQSTGQQRRQLRASRRAQAVV